MVTMIAITAMATPISIPSMPWERAIIGEVAGKIL